MYKVCISEQVEAFLAGMAPTPKLRLRAALAKLADEIPAGDGWLYEPKWDGFRCLVFRDNDDVQLISRNGNTGDRENVNSLFLNLGKVRTRGIDVAINWRGDVGPGTLTAGTVNLGTTSATSVGAGGAPILTASSSVSSLVEDVPAALSGAFVNPFAAGVACGIGSNMITKKLLDAQDYQGIENNVRQVIQLVTIIKAELAAK